MLMLSSRLLNVPLMSLQTGAQIGVTSGAIIDPRELKIAAFYCEGPRVGFKPAVLHPSDIRDFGSMGIIVDSADAIIAPSELPRLQEIIDLKFKLDGKLVVEEGGRKIGKVTDYITDTMTFYVVKINVQPGMWQSILSSDLLITRTQIKSIDDKKIIVARADTRANEPIPKAMIDNPFRKVQPRPEAVEQPAS